MNVLQRRTLVDLAAITVLVIVVGLGFAWLIFFNKGTVNHFIFIFLVFMAVLSIAAFLGGKRKRPEELFDEREMKIYSQAQIRATMVLIMYLVNFPLWALVIFKNVVYDDSLLIRADALYAMALSSLFVKQLAESATILFQCWKEK